MIIKKARDIQVGDVLLLGPCEPEYVVTAIYRTDENIELRAKPSYPTGDEGADGTEGFISHQDDEYGIKKPERR